MSKSGEKKKIKPNPGDPVQCPDGDRDGCRPKGPSSLLVQVLPGGGAQGPISQRREPGEALAEGRRVTSTPKADRSTGLDTSLRGAERSFCGPERAPGQGLPVGTRVWLSTVSSGWKGPGSERGGQGGAGGSASGSDVWLRLRLEFTGAVLSCLVKLDSHTGSASSWISAPLTTGASTPLTSPLSLCWKAAPDCPGPQAGRAT